MYIFHNHNCSRIEEFATVAQCASYQKHTPLTYLLTVLAVLTDLVSVLGLVLPAIWVALLCYISWQRACDGVSRTVKRVAAWASLQSLFDNQIMTPHQLFFLLRLRCHLWTSVMLPLKNISRKPHCCVADLSQHVQWVELNGFTVCVQYQQTVWKSDNSLVQAWVCSAIQWSSVCRLRRCEGLPLYHR